MKNTKGLKKLFWMKEQLRKGEMSINQAYQVVKRKEKKQKVNQRIEEHASIQKGLRCPFWKV